MLFGLSREASLVPGSSRGGQKVPNWANMQAGALFTARGPHSPPWWGPQKCTPPPGLGLEKQNGWCRPFPGEYANFCKTPQFVYRKCLFYKSLHIHQEWSTPAIFLFFLGPGPVVVYICGVPTQVEKVHPKDGKRTVSRGYYQTCRLLKNCNLRYLWYKVAGYQECKEWEVARLQDSTKSLLSLGALGKQGPADWLLSIHIYICIYVWGVLGCLAVGILHQHP